MKRIHLCLAASLLSASSLHAADWPMWGRDASRNMVSTETDLPADATFPKSPDEGLVADLKETKNVAWAVKLGSNVYGNPVVAGGHVFVGTNNASPRDPKYQGDYGIFLCLDEKTGKTIWQLAVPKLAAGHFVDWEECGVCSSAAVDGDRVYVVTNRCEVLSLDVAGMSNGNDGDFKDEAKYTAGPGRPPIEQGPADADIIWKFDMRYELGAFPHLQTASNPLVVGDRIYVSTSNGVDWTEKHKPSPDAPAFICLDKKTGKLLGVEKSGIGSRTFASNWSAPAFGNVGGKPTLVFGGGDGFLYGFDPVPGTNGEMKELWRIDCNPAEYRAPKDGKPPKYRDKTGPSEVIATPIIFEDKVYVPIGQDPEHGPGTVGAMNCVSVTYAGDKASPAIAWQNKSIGATMSTPAIANGMLVVSDLNGFIFMLDPANGQLLWKHDTQSSIWASALIADGKIYVGDESRELYIFAADKTKKQLAKIDVEGPVYASAVAANKAVYIVTGTMLCKLEKK
jgi:outer membrane protein assembly factor BamB